jgi:histidine triad (HIT) family protein
MYNHEPENYVCPFCNLISGIKHENVLSVQSDIIYHDAQVTGFVGSHQWPNNHVNVLVVPNEHYENIFDLPSQFSLAIFRLTKRIAYVMKSVYNCDGISTRQHNEPEGNQDVWHYHVHVTPRFKNDNFYCSQRELMPITERAVHASNLRTALNQINSNKNIENSSR